LTPLEPAPVAALEIVTRRADVRPDTGATAERASMDAPRILDAAVPLREPRSASRFEPLDDADAWPGAGVAHETRPVVRVSIGRIEVRAVTAPAAPVRPAAPPRTGVPSLEEYLRARNGTTR
jgi:hypothetical protein